MGSGSNSSPKGTSSVPVLVAGSGPRGAVTVCISLKKHLLKPFKFMVLVIDSKYRKSRHCKRTHSPAAGPDKVPDLNSTQKAFQMFLTRLVFWGELLCFPGHLGLIMFPKHCGARKTNYLYAALHVVKWLWVVCDIEVRDLSENVRIHYVIYISYLFSHWVSPSLPR